jgi:transcriptional pleiotropic regulator of transition state genes
MKATGIVRKMDELGRYVIPIELRKKLKINEKDPIAIFNDGELIYLEKAAAVQEIAVMRPVDELGRVVIPMELRRKLGIGEKEPMELFLDGDKIVLKKYAPGCVFCGSLEQLTTLHNKKICRACAKAAVKAGA